MNDTGHLSDEIIRHSRRGLPKYGRRSASGQRQKQLLTSDTCQDQFQSSLERSWKGLDKFKQFHKGRLDSAKNGFYTRGDVRRRVSPNLPIYSPSVLENNVPSRSKSEMSNFVPYYVYENIKKVTEGDDKDEKFRSRSTEDLYHDEQLEKSIKSYKMKIAKEDQLRQQMIRELLLQNADISERMYNRRQEIGIYNTVSKYTYTGDSSAGDDNDPGDKGGDVFIIPELPRGKLLVIYIISTWGDRYYVGLNGIEIFGDDGKIVEVETITACPPDVNILPECSNDPRIVSNLLDGVNRTQDDVHLWLAPFNEGMEHTVTIDFKETKTLAMIRIWNYNKSRIHSFRGIKDIVITLDDTPIFKGEIAKACGGMVGGVDAFGDTILFTTDETILELISHNDNSFFTLTATQSDTEIDDRPPTSLNTNCRPVTGAASTARGLQESVASSNEEILFGGYRLDIILLSNWASVPLIGLTGIQIVGGLDYPLDLDSSRLACNFGNEDLGNLINGEYITTDVRNMWTVPYKAGTEVIISYSFKSFTYLSGIKIWNYNNPEMTDAGVHTLKIQLDGIPVLNPLTNTETFLVRRAPGNTHYDFVQDIQFASSSNQVVEKSIDNELQLNTHDEEYERSSMPTGFVFQIIIFSTWGDQYYCGLNGIEVYGKHGRKINLEEHNICAYPESINVLPDVCGDIRTPDKLIDGINSDHSGAHSWLAPIIPKCLNRIYIVLDQPTTVSFIKLWNYSKTVSRGIKEFGILVDDLLVYNGILEKFINKPGSVNYRTVVFTSDDVFTAQTNSVLLRHGGEKQEILMLTENLRGVTGGSLPNPDQTLRPFTSVSPFNRGFTSYSN